MIRLNLLFHIQNLALSQWSNKRLKRVRMNHNIIEQVVQYCDIHVDKDAGNNVIMKRVGNGGLYYCLIAKYASLCRSRQKGLSQSSAAVVDGLPCYQCKQIIYDREECVSMARSHGKKYLHPECARKLNIIE